MFVLVVLIGLFPYFYSLLYNSHHLVKSIKCGFMTFFPNFKPFWIEYVVIWEIIFFIVSTIYKAWVIIIEIFWLRLAATLDDADSILNALFCVCCFSFL